MSPQEFKDQLAQLTAQLAGRALDTSLQEWLNTEYSPDTVGYQALRAACLEGLAQGWLCDREGGGLRYGRIFKPAPELQGFSVDVVDMKDLAGPHHSHPLGEIDLIMPIDETARFDDHPAGWLVCPPGSAHHPTVTQGRSLVLYLLPQGRIEFTR